MAAFFVAGILYLAATLAYGPAWLDKARRFRPLATTFLLTAVVVHGLAIAGRWLEAGYPPLSNGFEAFSFYAWLLATGYLLLEWESGSPGLGALVTPIALVAVIVAAALPKEIQPLLPALRSRWLGIHVGVSFLAYAALTLAFAMAAAYLRQDRVLKRHAALGWGEELPSLIGLEVLEQRLALAGFLLLSAALATGSAWARQAWGTPWVWEPQQIAALVTWGVYGGYLVAWRRLQWRGRRAAWLLVVGFVAVVVTFVGVDLVLPGRLHGFIGR